MIRYLPDGRVDRLAIANRFDGPDEHLPAIFSSVVTQLADALDAANERIRALEAAPTSEEVRSLVRVLSERGKKIEWDGGGVSADQQLLHAADVIERLDRERQEQTQAKEAAVRLWNACGEDLQHAEAALAEARKVATKAAVRFDENERDAMRYRWLRKNWTTLRSDATKTSLTIVPNQERWADFNEACIDAAIDAAIAASAKEPK